MSFFLRVLCMVTVSTEPTLVLWAGPPIAYHASYQIRIDGTSVNLNFDWSEIDRAGWSFGQGYYVDRILTDYCFARVIHENLSVIVRLPKSFFNVPSPLPEIIVVNPRNLDAIRVYRDIEPGRGGDALLSVIHFDLTADPGKTVAGMMSQEERKLIREIERGSYFTLIGASYERSQWQQSQELSQRIAALNQVTLLAHPAVRSHPDPRNLAGFYEFTSRFLWNGKKGVMVPRRQLYEFDGEDWRESNIATYRRSPVGEQIVNCGGLRWNIRDHSLYYDPLSGRLTRVRLQRLETLLKGVFLNPP